MTTAASNDHRVLLIPPTRRDGEVTRDALSRAAIACTVCSSLGEVAREIDAGVGAIMLTEIALSAPDVDVLLNAVERQPSWSNIPVVMLCREREQSPVAWHGTQRLGNMVLLDRPASLRSMVSAVKSALRGRRWQYQIRDQMIVQLRAEDALRQADQRKDEFLATLAHELRNPLAPIKTGLHVLRHLTTMDDEATRLFEMMERQTGQLVRLIDELLDVSRIATGKVVLRRELTDIRAVVRSAIESVQPALMAGRHDLRLQLPPHEITVFGDASRLAQALGNVLNNAAKYTPDGGRITVSAALEDGTAVVKVADNGMGIPADMLERVFDLFTQVDRTLDRAQGGLGIGLSLVRSLMTLHGGAATAHSAGTDQGSTFELRLPAVQTPHDDERNGTASTPSVARTGLRVMVVDDNADAADSLAMLLEFGGHSVRVAYSAAHALEAAPDFMPEAVLCDLGMPALNGYDFALKLRQDRRFASTVLIAVTGWGAEEDQRRSRAAGFDFHLTKPASPEAIEQILSGRGARQLS